MPERGPQPTEADPAHEASSRVPRARSSGSAPGPVDAASAPVDAASAPVDAASAPVNADGGAASWSGTERPPAAPEAPAHGPFELNPEPFELSVMGRGHAEGAGPRRSRARRILLTAMLAVALAGVAVLGWATWQITSQKNATVTTPSQVAGLRLDDSQSGRDTADYLQNALSAEVDLDKAVGAVYADRSGHDVLFFGGTALIWSPANDLKAAFGLISDDQGAVTNIHDVPAGRYGGTMRCGTTATSDGAMPVCGWADHGSLALAMFPH